MRGLSEGKLYHMHHNNFNVNRCVDAILVVHRRTIDDAVWEEGQRDRQNFVIR
jgi:hypothetical protein